jgi:hypothetical protein
MFEATVLERAGLVRAGWSRLEKLTNLNNAENAGENAGPSAAHTHGGCC